MLLSPRELNAASLPTRTFINEHLTFTHGMGLTLGPVNQVTTEGLPVLFVKDLPPVSTVSLRITRPQIYYGELANEYVFVGTRQREFDHPSGETNVYAAYTGTGGVRVGNLWRRIVLATRFGSSKILLSQDITNDSRVLYHRNIMARAKKALPFLRFDRDPYMVIADDGTLQVDPRCLHHDGDYPYAQRLRRRHDLHAEQRQARHRRVRRVADRLRQRPGRSADPDLVPHLPRHLRPAGQHAGRSARAHPLPG